MIFVYKVESMQTQLLILNPFIQKILVLLVHLSYSITMLFHHLG